MKIDILSLFPEMFTGVLNTSILKRAIEKNAVQFNLINFRDYSKRSGKKVDDAPFGGGAGMLLQVQPIFDAVESQKEVASNDIHVVMMCPQGTILTQKKSHELSKKKHILFICGHYEGYDERIRENIVDEVISIGDYVLTGGELACMVVIDSIVRLLPNVLGNKNSITTDSHTINRLTYPQYTRPANFRGYKVPDILLSGHHKNIEKWRYKQSFIRTYLWRPELLVNHEFTEEEKNWLHSLKAE